MLDLKHQTHLSIRQRKELAELFGFETRNKYEIYCDKGLVIGFVAEQGRSIFNHIGRYFFGHWRRFEIHIYDINRNKVAHAVHPFSWFFQRLEIYNENQIKVGSLKQRFSLFNKKFDILDSQENLILRVSSPFWRLWTFKIKDFSGQEKACIEKKWSGLLKEVFTDSDNFKLYFYSQNLDSITKNILMLATVFIDLQYFEKKANN
jgi:hypothetical protein